MLTKLEYAPYIHRRPKCGRKPQWFCELESYGCVYDGARCVNGESGCLEIVCYAQPRKRKRK